MDVLRNPTVRQIWVAFPILFTKVSTGMGFGFTSCFLTAIREPASDITMDVHTATWFVSSYSLSFILGYSLGALAMSRFGRRLAMTFSAVPGIVGQFITYFAGDVSTLMVGRILAGVSNGGNSIVGMTSIGEYASPKNRGMFLNMSTAILNIGSLLVHAVGYYTSWRTLAIITAVPYTLCMLVAFASPESPFWLAERKQYERSREAFYWLRGRTEDSTREIEELIRAQQHKTVDMTNYNKIKIIFLKFKKRNFLKPLGISLISILLTEASGRHIFPSYAGQLITEIMPSGVNIYYCNIVIDLLIIASGFSAAYMVRVMRMRTLLFSTGAATAAVLALACLSLYLVKTGLIPERYSILSLVLFGLFVIFGSSGCTCIPFALSGELFPLEHKAVSCLIYYCVAAVIMSVFLKIMPYMVSAIHIYGVFLVLAGFITVVLVIMYYILPETSNKTLQEIEEYFEEGTQRDHNVESGGDEQESLRTLNNEGYGDLKRTFVHQ